MASFGEIKIKLVDVLDLPYVVTQVIHATEDAPEERIPFAAFASPAVADWFTDQLRPESSVHFETVGLSPEGFDPASLAGLVTADSGTS